MQRNTSLCLFGVLIFVALIQLAPQAVAADEKPRVFITDSQSWEIAGGGGGSSAGFGGAVKGGARPQKAEIIKTFGERCPQVIINNKQDRADYIVLLDHEGGKGLVLHDNKVAVFNKDGDSILGHSTRSLGNAVKDACAAIVKDWPLSAAKLRAPAPNPAPAAATQTAESAGSATSNGTDIQPAGATLEIVSSPPNADIELDGSFAGNTPSSLGVAAGEHTLRISKAGYGVWERKIRSSTGTVRIAAELAATTAPAVLPSSVPAESTVVDRENEGTKAAVQAKDTHTGESSTKAVVNSPPVVAGSPAALQIHPVALSSPDHQSAATPPKPANGGASVSAGNAAESRPSISIPSLGIMVSSKADGGAEIVDVASGSVAELANLRVGYVITSVNGKPVNGAMELAAGLQNRAPSSQVRLGYLFRSSALGYFLKETVVIVGSNK